MDEQRVQAYVALIEQLLSCPQGQEAEILQAKAELVDAGLLEVMEQVADYLESQGDSNAGWLRSFAAQLAQALGTRAGQSAMEADEAQEAEKFLLETLQLIADSQGNPQQIYPVWAQQQAQLNTTLLAILPQVGAQLLAGEAEQRTWIAAVLVVFGSLIWQFPLGTRWLNVELAIAAYQQALSVMTQQAMPVDWATTTNNLAIAYSDRIRGDRAQNIELAIAAYQQALTVMTQQAMPVDWATTTMNLAAAYKNRIRGDRAQNIELAIAAYQQALTVMTQQAMPVDWAQTTNNLANAYYSRIRGDRAENIEQAIAAYQQALTVRTQQAMPVDWATTTNNLAAAYSDRIRGDRAQNIEQAIDAYQQALTVRTQQAMPVDWATTTNNLAAAYSDRIRGDRAQNIEQAIAAYQQALTVRTQQAMPVDWATTTNNLAAAYSARICGDRAENIEQAIDAYQQALTVRTQQAMPVEWAQTTNNLANAYSDRICGDRAENIEQAIDAYCCSLEVFTPELLPDDCRRTARSLGNLYSDQQCWQEAVPIYEKALQASEILYQSANLLDGKAAELTETADLPRRAAYALARSGHLHKAVEVLEQSRARGLSETLERDRADLENLKKSAPTLYEQYINVTTQLRNLEAQQRSHATSGTTPEEQLQIRQNLTPEAHRTEAIHLRKSLETVIEQIRQVEGYADFLDQPSFNDILAALQPDRPLVYLVPTPAGSLALIIHPPSPNFERETREESRITALWLDDLTEISLREILQAWFNAYDQSQTDRQSWYNAIAQTTQQLWQPLMAPLIAKLQALGFEQATLIPTGYLSLLPLHAAWTEDPSTPTGKRYALDDIHFTYASNARSLKAAQQIRDRISGESLLAIDNPRNDLPNSSREITAATASFTQPKILQHEHATVAAVLAALPHASHLHLSCHGTANFNTPLNSGLLMADGLLTLRDLLDLKLTEGPSGGLRLAILSACETGLPGLELADEAISLPTGLLQAGVAGVVASLWSVADLSTMMLLVRFYDYWREDKLEPAIALRQAQKWLRDTTNLEKATFFKTVHSQSAKLHPPTEVANYLFQELILARPTSQDFAHPFHWAAFSYTGI
ncbi:CHAT domain-containing tetratricopeptide repeat protein [Sphaerothrix gracilis]|uniref:CHAT domain-containing tetratricopeptide repeat protein n=1 Tax=Sphaerothrix gracilis TaxID=3151835 RepID=UPI0031FDF918